MKWKETVGQIQCLKIQDTKTSTHGVQTRLIRRLICRRFTVTCHRWVLLLSQYVGMLFLMLCCVAVLCTRLTSQLLRLIRSDVPDRNLLRSCIGCIASARPFPPLQPTPSVSPPWFVAVLLWPMRHGPLHATSPPDSIFTGRDSSCIFLAMSHGLFQPLHPTHSPGQRNTTKWIFQTWLLLLHQKPMKLLLLVVGFMMHHFLLSVPSQTEPYWSPWIISSLSRKQKTPGTSGRSKSVKDIWHLHSGSDARLNWRVTEIQTDQRGEILYFLNGGRDIFCLKIEILQKYPK